MATADFHARGGGGDQRAGDTQLFFSAQQTIRVREFESQPQHGGDRRQRDITFVPGQAHPQHLLTLPVAHAHHAGIRDGAGVRARFRAGESEARDFQAACQTRQIMILLFFGTVMLQQFARAQRVRDADGDRQDAGDAREFLQYSCLSVSGKLKSAILFLNDHREEAVLFQIGPQLRRQIGHFVGDGEVVSHPAGFFNWAVEESLLFGGQPRLRIVM